MPFRAEWRVALCEAAKVVPELKKGSDVSMSAFLGIGDCGIASVVGEAAEKFQL